MVSGVLTYPDYSVWPDCTHTLGKRKPSAGREPWDGCGIPAGRSFLELSFKPSNFCREEYLWSSVLRVLGWDCLLATLCSFLKQMICLLASGSAGSSLLCGQPSACGEGAALPGGGRASWRVAFSHCGAPTPGEGPPVTAALGLWSTGCVAVTHGWSCPVAGEVFRYQDRAVSPALAGGFVITGAQGSPPL